MRIAYTNFLGGNISDKEYFPTNIKLKHLSSRINEIANIELPMHMDKPDSTTQATVQRIDIGLSTSLPNNPPMNSLHYDIIDHTPLDLFLSQEKIAHLDKPFDKALVPQPSNSADHPLQQQGRTVSPPVPVDFSPQHDLAPKTGGEKNTVASEAFLPQSPCYNTALPYNISQQDIAKWYQIFFGVNVHEPIDILKASEANTSNEEQTIRETRVIRRNSIRRPKQRKTLQQKKCILQDICDKNLSTLEYNKRFGVSFVNIYRWSKSIYQMNFTQLRQHYRSAPALEGKPQHHRLSG